MTNFEVELLDGTILRTSERNDLDWITFAVIFTQNGIKRMIPWHQVKEVRLPEGQF